MKIPTHVSRSTATTLYMVFAFICAFIFSGGCCAQSTAITVKNYSIKGLSELYLDLGKVQLKTSMTGSTTVTVERHISVNHSSLDREIMVFVKNSGAYNEESLTDHSTDSLTLSEKQAAAKFVARNEAAEITIEYVVIVPDHIKIFSQ